MVANRLTDEPGFKVDEYPGGKIVMIGITGFRDRDSVQYEAEWKLYAARPFNGEQPIAFGTTDSYTSEALAAAAATRAAVECMKP